MLQIFSEEAAKKIANDYSLLIGCPMLPPYSGCKIDRIEIQELKWNKGYQIQLVHDVFVKRGIPEIFLFKKVKVELSTYLEAIGI